MRCWALSLAFSLPIHARKPRPKRKLALGLPLALAHNDRMTASELHASASDISDPAQSRAWDDFVKSQPRAHLLQTSSWGRLKARFGWGARIITLRETERIVAGALVLLKPLPFMSGKMAYAPMGGYVLNPDQYPRLWQAIRRETGAAFLKLEPGHGHECGENALAAMGFQASPQTIQPPRSIIIDVDCEDDAILRRMNQGTRRKIRKSQAGGIIYSEGTCADLPAFNQLMQATGERNDFGVHNAAYFDAVYELLMPDYGALLLARHEGELLAAIMVFALGDNAWYLYGASSRAKRNLYATYGLQWQAIQWARRRGCRQYDLWGVPDYDRASLEAQFKERSNGLWGVYGFKRGFGGTVIRSPGAWDLAWNPIVYAAYRASLKLRR